MYYKREDGTFSKDYVARRPWLVYEVPESLSPLRLGTFHSLATSEYSFACSLYPLNVFTIYCLYRYYQSFLQQVEGYSGEERLDILRKIYLQPCEVLAQAFARRFLDGDLQILERVLCDERFADHYYRILQLVGTGSGLDTWCEQVLWECCQQIVPNQVPEVYLWIGPFVANSVLTLNESQRYAICISLELFSDLGTLETGREALWASIALVLAHEYGHCLRYQQMAEQNGWNDSLLEKLCGEGLAAKFSQTLFPMIPLHHHLLLSPAELAWCEYNEDLLWKIVSPYLLSSAPGLIRLFLQRTDKRFASGMPECTGYFIGYRLVDDYLRAHSQAILKNMLPLAADAILQG
ncbi:MAG: DUF2268 domain-containing putative Zn-dependent protease, partial [candidate division WOR-3 bacterium]